MADEPTETASAMTPLEFYRIRKRANMTQQQVTDLLRLGDARTVRRYETGERAIPGPVSLLMEMIDNKVI